MRRRLEKVQEKVSPEHDGSYTWEEFNRLLWQLDKQKYRETANGPDGYMCRSFVAQFEREDEARCRDGLSCNRTVG
jgi:hypothetical protein